MAFKLELFFFSNFDFFSRSRARSPRISQNDHGPQYNNFDLQSNNLDLSFPDFDLFFAFMGEVTTLIDANSEDGSVLDIFKSVLREVQTDIQKNVKLGHGSSLLYADMVQFFTCSPAMAKVR